VRGVVAAPIHGLPGSHRWNTPLSFSANTGPEYHGGLGITGRCRGKPSSRSGASGRFAWVERYCRAPRGTPVREPPESRRCVEGGRSAGGTAWATGSPSPEPRGGARVARSREGSGSPALSPGIVAAAFHGVIRTAHAARSPRTTETCRFARRGLAYWARTMRPFPESRARAPRGGCRQGPWLRSGRPGLRVLDGNITEQARPCPALRPFANRARIPSTRRASRLSFSPISRNLRGRLLASVLGKLITFITGSPGAQRRFRRSSCPHLDAPAKARGASTRVAGRGRALLGVRRRRSGAPRRRTSAHTDNLIPRDRHRRRSTPSSSPRRASAEHAVNPKLVYLLAAAAPSNGSHERDRRAVACPFRHTAEEEDDPVSSSRTGRGTGVGLKTASGWHRRRHDRHAGGGAPGPFSFTRRRPCESLRDEEARGGASHRRKVGPSRGSNAWSIRATSAPPSAEAVHAEARQEDLHGLPGAGWPRNHSGDAAP